MSVGQSSSDDGPSVLSDRTKIEDKETAADDGSEKEEVGDQGEEPEVVSASARLLLQSIISLIRVLFIL